MKKIINPNQPLSMVGMFVVLTSLGASPAVFAATLSDSTGPNGINSQGLGLTGAGIGIGQVEVERSGLPGFDNAANSHPNVIPAGVFLRNGAAVANTNTSNHAEQVAGIMISNAANPNKGVAPRARLFSSTYDVPVGDGQAEALLSIQHIARQNINDVRAINMSFGEGGVLNGNSLLTQGLDWSAREHNVLYVKSRGNIGQAAINVPADNFNGINVAASTQDGGIFQKVSDLNNFTNATNGRRLTSLIAPGEDIQTPILGGGFNTASGSSLAAPHVTGTVALLQEFGDRQIAANQPHWNLLAQRHEVMKAVLMNSVDKIKDDGTAVSPLTGQVIPRGNLLDMEKTIVQTDGTTTWFQSDAFRDTLLPLDNQMGTGQLNASRALTQFRPGEWDSLGSAEVPLIGWDYGVTLFTEDFKKYIFDQPLLGGSFVSITLAWDREISFLNDANGNGMYDTGDTFKEDGLTNLDLYLLPKGANNFMNYVNKGTVNPCASDSTIYSVEHIFCEIPITGEYEFWVRQADAPVGNQFYGVAWWAKACPPPPRRQGNSQREAQESPEAVCCTVCNPRPVPEPNSTLSIFTVGGLGLLIGLRKNGN